MTKKIEIVEVVKAVSGLGCPELEIGHLFPRDKVGQRHDAHNKKTFQNSL